MGLYSSTQALLRFGFWLFYHKVHIRNKVHFPAEGPVLLVSNHPNSFMDALVIGAYLPRPTHFLARGDAFKNPILAKIFKAYYMLPVYRISEGKENIEKNFETFDASYDAVAKGGSVLIFGEGLCKNNWDLRPLKKGPARIANRAWNSTEAAQYLAIIPVGLTYEHFEGGGKSVIVNYGTPIRKTDCADILNTPGFTQQLNDRITSALKELAYINPTQQSNSEEHYKMAYAWQQAEGKGEDVLNTIKTHTSSHKGKKRWLTPLHYGLIALPHYWVTQLIAKQLTKGSVFYDSISFGIMLFLFPLYWLFVLALVFYLV
jgi:1-acyl-sn-glycerol-3-phosphate acyltransferase